MASNGRLSDKLKEECGVFGILPSPDDGIDACMDVYRALFALQHRGQESCGIAVMRDGGAISVHKDMGLVPEVFTMKRLEELGAGRIALGHVRYSGSGGSASAQPIYVSHYCGSMALCYNGHLVNSRQLRAETELRGGIFQSSSDSEVISYIIVREHIRTSTIEDAVINAMQYMIGAYSIVLMAEDKLIAVRDPNGYRPLCIGRKGGSYIFASESCAINAVGGELIRDVEPGEVVIAENGGLRSVHCGIKAKSCLCVFELIYFARPDSIIDGVSVDEVRMEAGRCLARKNTAEADVVIGAPDSGLSAARGFAQESGIPYDVGLVKNRYIARTFIQPGQENREKAVKIKLNALAATVKGKRVILVDDSIVRGTTCTHMVSILREAGAKEVHLKSSAPPFLYPCYFGTDIPDSESLIANNRSVEDVCKLIGADSLQYLSVEDLDKITKGLLKGYCDSCFSGKYTLPSPDSFSK